MDFRITRAEVEGSSKLLIRCGPVPVPKKRNLRQRGVRPTKFVVQSNGFLGRMTSFRERFVRRQTDLAKRVRLSQTGVTFSILSVFLQSLFEVLAGQLCSFFAELVQVKSAT